MGTVTIRIDEDVKRQAAAIAADFGFDLSSVTRAFYLQMIRDNAIPLNLGYPKPTEETRQSLDQSQQILQQNTPRFTSTDQLFDSLGI